MIQIEDNYVCSSTHKYVVRKSTGIGGGSGILTVVAGETATDFEEADELPAPAASDSCYKKRVIELIRERYDDNKEFEIQREMICAMVPEAALGEDGEGRARAVDPAEALAAFRAYNAYVEECRARAREELNIT